MAVNTKGVYYRANTDALSTVEAQALATADSIPVGPNYIINGGFDIWQRGTNFSSATSPYTADRWQLGRSSSSGASVYQLTGGPTGIQYATRVQRDSGNASTNIIYFAQSLESRDSIPLAGSTVTLSFYAHFGAQFSAASAILGATVIQGTGTNQNLISTGFSGQTTVVATSNVLTSGWQRFTATGIVSTAATQIGVYFSYTPVGTAGANDYFDIAGVQLEAGSYATPFRRNAPSIQAELAACQRFYEKSYDLTTVPGTATTLGEMTFYGTTDGSQNIVTPVQFQVPKRTSSYTLTTYNGSGAAGYADYSRNGASGTLTTILYRNNDKMFHVYCGAGGVFVAANMAFHWTCNAEI